MNPMGWSGGMAPGKTNYIPTRVPGTFNSVNPNMGSGMGGGSYNTMHSPLSAKNMAVDRVNQAANDYYRGLAARQGLNNYYAQRAARQKAMDDLQTRRQANTRWGWEKEKFGWAKEDRGFLKEDRATAAADRARNIGREDRDDAWQEEQRAWQRQMWDRARNVFATGTGGGGSGGSIAVGGSYGVNQS